MFCRGKKQFSIWQNGYIIFLPNTISMQKERIMDKYAIVNANIITGKLDEDVVKGQSVIVENGKIADITDDKAKLAGLKIVDLQGKYLLPGLINMHVHLPGSGMPRDTKKQNKETVHKLMSHKLTKYIVYKMCAAYAKTELMSGVTTIRTVGGLDDIDSTIRDNGAAGKINPAILPVRTYALKHRKTRLYWVWQPLLFRRSPIPADRRRW